LFAGYQFLVYLGLFSLALQPFKILSLLLLAASLLNALDGFLGLNAIPPFAAVEPIYFLAVYGKYFLLSIVAFLVAVPRAERAYVLPIVPLYFFYALAQVVPVSVGYANWVAVRLANRRLFQDHYQDEVSLRQSKRSTATMENA
jgi:hypothetical protein